MFYNKNAKPKLWLAENNFQAKNPICNPKCIASHVSTINLAIKWNKRIIE